MKPHAQTASVITRIRHRPDFVAAASAVRSAKGAVVVQGRARNDGDPAIRVGFTATRKLGGAVVRNRCKRRLREATRALLPTMGLPGCDYVLIARQGTANREWLRLLDDVKNALISVGKDITRRAVSDSGAT